MDGVGEAMAQIVVGSEIEPDGQPPVMHGPVRVEYFTDFPEGQDLGGTA